MTKRITNSAMKLHLEFLHADTRVESADVGETEAIERTLSFPWDRELIEADSRKECSPTVSVEYAEEKHVLWASVDDKDHEPEFLVCLQERIGSQTRTVAERDGVGLASLPHLLRLFYRGQFDALRADIGKQSQKKNNEERTLERRLNVRTLALEIAPFIAAFAFSYFYPRYLLVALCVYSILALVSVSLSIRDGVVLEKYGLVCERDKEKFGFWFWVFWHAFFPLLILSVAAMFPKTLVWPPK